MLVMIAVTAWQALEADKDSSQSSTLPELSSLSARKNGAKAAYLVLEDLGREPVRWGRSFAQLNGKKGTLITFGTDTFEGQPIDSGEIVAIIQWVKEGNTVIACGDATTVFDLAIEEGPGAIAAGIGPLEGLRFPGFGYRFVKTAEGDKALVKHGDAVAGIERKMGEGEAYLFADALPFQNEWLGEGDNAALLTLAAPGRVFVDDFHRGHVASGSPLEVLPDALRVGLLLCVLVGVVAIAKQSFRFGPFEEQPLPERRSGAQIAWSLSRLLRHAGATGTAANEAVKAFKADVGISQGDPVEDALDRLTVPNPDLEKRVKRALENPQHLQELVSALAQLRNAIKDEARGRYITK
jgi:hypothetical protein